VLNRDRTFELPIYSSALNFEQVIRPVRASHSAANLKPSCSEERTNVWVQIPSAALTAAAVT
jgi:hypothetical protein